jgi:hypothetical protein
MVRIGIVIEMTLLRLFELIRLLHLLITVLGDLTSALVQLQGGLATDTERRTNFRHKHSASPTISVVILELVRTS